MIIITYTYTYKSAPVDNKCICQRPNAVLENFNFSLPEPYHVFDGIIYDWIRFFYFPAQYCLIQAV